YAGAGAVDGPAKLPLDWMLLVLLGGRPTVGHMALDHGIGVRIPASQPQQHNEIGRSTETASLLGTSRGHAKAGRQGGADPAHRNDTLGGFRWMRSRPETDSKTNTSTPACARKIIELQGSPESAVLVCLSVALALFECPQPPGHPRIGCGRLML